ncbi:hypothetical protein, partial [Pyrobaculum sp.]|uniref:hypothetical protein n=1 Tax=Pyrobaculum sp. TaxID=2004705 RepID=UPI003D135FF6
YLLISGDVFIDRDKNCITIVFQLSFDFWGWFLWFLWVFKFFAGFLSLRRTLFGNALHSYIPLCGLTVRHSSQAQQRGGSEDAETQRHSSPRRAQVYMFVNGTLDM